MNVLYAINSTVHLVRHKQIICNLLSRGHRVHAEFFRGWENQAVEDISELAASHPSFSFGQMIVGNGRPQKAIFSLRELRSYASYLGRKQQSQYYLQRWEDGLPEFLKTWATSSTGKACITRWPGKPILDFLAAAAIPSSTVCSHLKSLQPDVVVSTPANYKNAQEIEYLAAARKLGIPSVIPVANWDHLTTKGLIHVIPDVVLVWNEPMAQEAVSIHQIPSDRVLITGSPFLEKWFSSRLSLSFSQFCHRVGLPADRPFCLYLGSSKGIAKDESWVVEELLVHLRNNEITRDLNILVRPHPRHTKPFMRFRDGDGIFVWPKEGGFATTDDEVLDFHGSIAHSTVTLGINSTSMLDTLVLDKPCISLTFEQFRLTQVDSMHYQQIERADVLETASSPADAADLVAQIHKHGENQLKKRRRKEFVDGFVRPLGLTAASEATASAIELLASGQDAKAINDHLRANLHSRSACHGL